MICISSHGGRRLLRCREVQSFFAATGCSDYDHADAYIFTMRITSLLVC